MTPEPAAHPMQRQAEMLAQRVLKNFKHLRKSFEKAQIGAFRLYDWDIPEIRAVVDWYEGHLLVAEYARRQTDDLPDWLPTMAAAVAHVLDIPEDHVVLKRRHTGAGVRYKKLGTHGERFVVRERDLRFWVNLSDHIDTGLFPDHRETRQMVRERARDADFLNLFAYTGAFTCAAAMGSARTTTTVDLSNTYLTWAQENLGLNTRPGPQHTFVREDALRFLEHAAQAGRRWTLAVVDPPSFSASRGMTSDFDVLRDHRRLLVAALAVLAPGAELFFSTNHQRFVPELEDLPVASIREITARTVPADYRNKQVHRCWHIVAPA